MRVREVKIYPLYLDKQEEAEIVDQIVVEEKDLV